MGLPAQRFQGKRRHVIAGPLAARPGGKIRISRFFNGFHNFLSGDSMQPVIGRLSRRIVWTKPDPMTTREGVKIDLEHAV